MKLTKTLDLLARPRGFESLTLGLEMQGIGYTNDIVLHRFVILQYLLNKPLNFFCYAETIDFIIINHF